MEFASEQERYEWASKENKRVAESNAETLKQSAAAVEKHREERAKRLADERASEPPEPRLRRGQRPPDGTLVSAPEGPGPGDDEDDEDDELEGDDDEFEDEDDEDDED